MKRLLAITMLCVPLLQGCALRFVTIHDGLSTTVVDFESGAPIAAAGLYAYKSGRGEPQLVATSDNHGLILADPKRSLSVLPLMGEAIIDLQLWVYKEGYEPQMVAFRAGWNVDFAVEVHKVDSVKLKAAGKATYPGSCLHPCSRIH